MIADKCPFTERKPNHTWQSSDNTVIFFRMSFGTYGMAHEAFLFLKDKIDEKQGLILCARKVMEICKEDKRAIPIFTTSTQFKNRHEEYADLISEEVKVPLLLKVEEHFSDYVDHSLKPLEILKIAARKIGTKDPSTEITFDPDDMIWARISTHNELHEHLAHLGQTNSIKVIQGIGSFDHKLQSPIIEMRNLGWKLVSENRTTEKTNYVFIAAQFDWENELKEARMPALLAIKNACTRLGYEADYVSQNHTGYITDRIISDIKRCNFMIADLTYNNRGVYYEAGLARGLDKKVFHLIHEDHIKNTKDKKRIHFDIAQIIYRKWKSHTEIEEIMYDWIDSTIGAYGAKATTSRKL